MPDGLNRVQKFTSTGDYLKSFVDQHIANPQGIAVDPDGNLYITTGSARSMSKFNADGQFLTEFTLLGCCGYGLERDEDGSILTGGPGSYLERVTSNGDFVADTLLSWSVQSDGTRGLAADASGNVLVVQTHKLPPNEISVLSHDFSRVIDDWNIFVHGDPNLPLIDDLAATSDGYLYMVDWIQNRVLKFQYSAPTPTLPVTWGSLKARYR